MFREKDLLSASNAYLKLDSTKNFSNNKAFAHTVLNDLKQRQR